MLQNGLKLQSEEQEEEKNLVTCRYVRPSEYKIHQFSRTFFTDTLKSVHF